jgi:hypothetical protein
MAPFLKKFPISLHPYPCLNLDINKMICPIKKERKETLNPKSLLGR